MGNQVGNLVVIGNMLSARRSVFRSGKTKMGGKLGPISYYLTGR